MTGFFDKLFRRRSIKAPKHQPPSFTVPTPCQVQSTGADDEEYDYVFYVSPAVERIERQYTYTSARLSHAKKELKHMEDSHIRAVLEGKPCRMDTICFHDSYEGLRSHIRELESQRRSLRRRVHRVRRDVLNHGTPTTVHYPPL